jgi:tetratricopeptide (TPR) repeat protein
MSSDALFRAGADALAACDFSRASRLFGEIVAADPRAHAAWNALSVVAARAGFADIAVEHARRALELDRRNVVYLNNLAIAQAELGLLEECEATLRKALKAKPVYVEALYNLGKVLVKQGRLDEALKSYQRAHAIDADFPALRRNLALVYRSLGQPLRAIALLREAQQSSPSDQDVPPVLGAVLCDAEGPAAALAYLAEVVERHPDWPDARLAAAHIHLGMGDWRAGWREYYWRQPVPLARPAPAPLPERLDGKRILLQHEQGLGDILFFLRFAPQLAARGARLVLSRPEKLASILTAGGVLAQIIGPDDEVKSGEFDSRIRLGDLPVLLGTDHAPPPWPLAVDAARRQRWAERLAQFGPRPYIALTWRAGTDLSKGPEFRVSTRLLYKAIAPQSLGAALRGLAVTLLSLQRLPYRDEVAKIAAAAAATVHDLSALNDDLADMLAVLSLLDDYVTVSNTNVHLLAGLGKTAKVLVPFPPEWRWMRSGEGSPWFPGFRVYRERPGQDWSDALAALRAALA